jgi:hypothetical protein
VLRVEQHLEAVNLEAVVQEGGTTGAETIFIGLLVIVGMRRIECCMVCREMRHCLGAGGSQCWNDGGCGGCITQCMLYSVYAVLSVCYTHGVHCTRCYLSTMAWRDKER